MLFKYKNKNSVATGVIFKNIRILYISIAAILSENIVSEQ